MIEIEFSALIRLCPGCRIPTFEQLETEILALCENRDRNNIKINWQFSVNCARHKLNSQHYALQADNSKSKIT